MNLKKYIKSVPNYPKKGILFRDITSLLEHKQAFQFTIKNAPIEQKDSSYQNSSNRI